MMLCNVMITLYYEMTFLYECYMMHLLPYVMVRILFLHVNTMHMRH